MTYQAEILFDKYGKRIEPYDLLKVFHFVGARRKKYFMYKHVIQCQITGALFGDHLINEGKFMLRSIARKDGVLEDAEIIQGIDLDKRISK